MIIKMDIWYIVDDISDSIFFLLVIYTVLYFIFKHF